MTGKSISTNAASITTGVTLDELQEYLDQGCIFLPASGNGNGYGGNNGYYTSATSYNNDNRYFPYFSASYIGANDRMAKTQMCSVRLVR